MPYIYRQMHANPRTIYLLIYLHLIDASIVPVKYEMYYGWIYIYSLRIVNTVRFEATASCVNRVRFGDRDSRWTRLPLIKATRPSVRLPRESRRGINSDGAWRTPLTRGAARV